MKLSKSQIINPQISKTIFPYLYIERDSSVYSFDKYYNLIVFNKNNNIQYNILDRIINSTITTIIYNYIIRHDLTEFLH